MKHAKLMEHFESLAEKLGLKIVNGKGNFSGGGCILRKDKMIVLNKMKPIEQRLRVLAQEFALLNLEEVFVVPALRKFIAEYTTFKHEI
tara:strand:+ start:544 stop:810 length:267 start_codon:yes stop_codon:yes gene_type:complete